MSTTPAEFKALVTACGVSASQLAQAVDNCISQRALQRYLASNKYPDAPLRRLVINDILVGLRLAYAKRQLPVDREKHTARTPQDTDALVKAVGIKIIKDAIHEARRLVEPSR